VKKFEWRYLFVGLINVAIIAFAWLAALQGVAWISLVSVVLLAIFDVVFLLKRGYPYRYLFPGLVTFLVFMVFPILFTISIGFTNLGTGHMLSFDVAKNILLSERFVPVGSPVYELQVGETVHSYEIFLTEEQVEKKFWGSIEKTSGDFSINLQAFDHNLSDFSAERNISLLSKRRVYQLMSFLKKLELVLPGGENLYYSGISKFSAVKSRYMEHKEKRDVLVDLQSGEEFYPDMDEGVYKGKGEFLSPGFSVSVGFKNFMRLFSDSKIAGPFLKVFIWTFVWALFTVVLTFAVGMILALMLNKDTMKFRFLYRMLLIIPYSIPFFISVLIFKGLMNKDFGAFNEILMSWFAIKIPWLEHSMWAKVSCLVVNLWLGFPYMLLVLTGILQSIPADVYEAAKIDGAGRWTTFWKITLPMIMSAVAPLLVGTFAFNFNNFVGIYLLTGGLPPMEGAATPVGDTDILISYTYRLAFEGGSGQDFGLASAISIIIFVIIAVLTLINFRLSGVIKKKDA